MTTWVADLQDWCCSHPPRDHEFGICSICPDGHVMTGTISVTEQP